MDYRTPGFSVLHDLLEFAQTHVHRVGGASNHLILCRPLLLPSIFPSTRVFSNESALHIKWPKYWSFSFSISLSNEYLVLISFRMGWFDLLAVKGTPKSFLQHHSSKASILRCSAFFMVQLSHLYFNFKNYMHSGKKKRGQIVTRGVVSLFFKGRRTRTCVTRAVLASPSRRKY